MQLRTDDLTWSVVGDDVIALDLKGSVYLQLSGSGRVLWEAIVDGCDEQQLVELLCEQYSVDAERAASDVAAFLSDMRRRDLLVR